MKRNTRKMLLNLATGIAVAATAAVVFLPAAQAAPATATQNVNVRSGPGTSYNVVDALRRGEQVDVQQCQGTWCYINQDGPSGWVSSNYLSAGSGGGGSTGTPSFNFGINVPGGPSFNIGVGNQPSTRPVPPRPPRYSEACFYENNRFRGASFCLEAGETYRLPRNSNGIASIENPDGLSVEVCSFRNCRVYTTSARNLGNFGYNATTVRVR